MFNHHRGLWGYTGAAPDGEPLTIQATGMGGPSAAIVLTELIALGARRAIRVGTCGALDPRARARASSWSRASRSARDGTSRALGAGERAARRPRADGARSPAAPGAARRHGRERRPLLRDAARRAPEPTRRSRSRWRPPRCSRSGAAAQRARGLRARRVGHLRANGARAGASTTSLCSTAAEAMGARRRRGARAVSAQRFLGLDFPACAAAPGRLRAGAARAHLDAGVLGARPARPARRSAASSAPPAAPRSRPGAPRPALRDERPVEAVHAVLDALEPVRDRAQPPREPFDVGGRRDVQRAHRDLLRLRGLLARVERAPDRAREQRVLEQVGERPAEPVLGASRSAARAGFWRRCSGRTSLLQG